MKIPTKGDPKMQKIFTNRVFVLLLVVLSVPSIDALAQKIDVYSRPVQVERSHDYDVQHYRLELSFDVPNKVLKGSNEITIRSLRNEFSACLMDAGPNLTIHNVKDSDGNPLEYEHEGDKLTIRFPEAFNYDDTIRFAVDYSGVDPENDQKIFYDKSDQYPAMIWGPNFPNRVRNWMPCYDFPHDKTTHEMIIHAPPGFKAVSNGKLVGTTTDESTGISTWHWHQTLPHSTYLFVLAVGPYVVFEDSLGDLPVNYWVFPQDSRSALPAFSRTPEMIQFFNELYDFEYPWAKCDQVMIPPMGGAAESTTATLYSNSMITNLDEKGLKDYSFDRVIAHETAHHWWGDLITLRTWSETWLNESFGTYSDHIWTNRTKGEDEGAIDLEGKKNAYLNEAHTKYLRPIVFNRYDLESPGQNFDRHTYPKGALMLHLLRSILGDDLFFRTISHFLHKHAFQPVDTHDFMKTIKEVTGQNMDWFFEQFFYKPGHPVFEVSKNWDATANILTLEIVQTQDTAHDVPNAYRIPVNIGLYTADKKIIENLWLDERKEVFTFSLDKKPEMVKFDDDNVLLKELSYDQPVVELAFKLKNDDVVGRAEAASKLGAKTIDDQIMADLVYAAKNDDFWYVRRAALEGLEAAGYVSITDLSKEMTLDPDSQVRTSAIRILGDAQDSSLIRFFKQRFEREDSYRVQAECINSIGKCGSEGDIGFVEKAGGMRSPRNVIARAAERAIENLKKD